MGFQSSPPSSSSGRPAPSGPEWASSSSCFRRTNWSSLSRSPAARPVNTRAPEGRAELSSRALFQALEALCTSMAKRAASSGEKP